MEGIGIDECSEIKLAKKKAGIISFFFAHTYMNERGAYFDEPAHNDRAARVALLGIPDRLRRDCALGVSHVVSVPSGVGDIDEVFLRGRVGGPPTIMGRVEPPGDGEEGRPRGGKDVVREEEVGKVERAFWILLNFWREKMGLSGYGEKGADLGGGFQAPKEYNRGEGRVNVQAELSKRAACAGDRGDETIEPCDLVEELLSKV